MPPDRTYHDGQPLLGKIKPVRRVTGELRCSASQDTKGSMTLAVALDWVKSSSGEKSSKLGEGPSGMMNFCEFSVWDVGFPGGAGLTVGCDWALAARDSNNKRAGR